MGHGVVCVNSIYKSDDGETASEMVARNNLYRGQSPEAMRLGRLWSLCQQAEKENFGDTISGMLVHLGEKVYLSQGSSRNFKITTAEDIDVFKALLLVPATVRVKH